MLCKPGCWLYHLKAAASLSQARPMCRKQCILCRRGDEGWRLNDGLLAIFAGGETSCYLKGLLVERSSACWEEDIAQDGVRVGCSSWLLHPDQDLACLLSAFSSSVSSTGSSAAAARLHARRLTRACRSAPRLQLVSHASGRAARCLKNELQASTANRNSSRQGHAKS